jgi:cysteine desulfurase
VSARFVNLDYAAGTPVDARVAEMLMALYQDPGGLANPSAVHRAGRRASAMVDEAAGRLAALIGCHPDRLLWTSGATESNNLAIQGAAGYRATYRKGGKHLVTMQTEHKSVTDVFRALEKRGFEVTWLRPGADGLLVPETLRSALRDDTQLVSIMHVNNETGVTQDIAALGAICRAADVLFHVDAAQSAGKMPLDLANLPVDLLSVTAHKLYGPKGIGALFVADRPGCHIEPLFFGGGQQNRLRPGTLPVDLITAFGLAAEIAAAEMEADHAWAARLRERLWQGIHDLSGVAKTLDSGAIYPGILSVSVADVEGESLLLGLEPVCVATGSACNSRDQEPSRVLRSLGVSDERAQSTIRFSFGRGTTDAEIDLAAKRYRDTVVKLRELAPQRVV